MESNLLIEPFSEHEIKEAVFSCGDERAPGPNGMNFRFIKHFWNLFKDDFVRIFDWFYNCGDISLGSGASFITLVPKVNDPVSLINYRPINLVGAISKVISKVLANRMRMVLDGVISESQSAFLQGRYILDGPLIGILKSANSSVLVNGSPTFTFKCEKGMRQGDPLSPFLLLVVMDALSCMIDNALRAGVIQGISTPNNGASIAHLLYTDDAIVMGLKINIDKSYLYGIGVGLGEIGEMARRDGNAFRLKKSLSRVWNNIAKNFVNTKVGGRPLRSFMRGSIGNNEDVMFWLDTWLLDEPLKVVYPDLFSLEVDKRASVADRINSQNVDGRYSWSWNSVMLDSGTRSSLNQLVGLLDNVQLTAGKARWKWISESDGLFSVKAVKKLLKEDQVQENNFVLEWCNWVPAKVNIHAWRLEMNKVPTAEALRRRNIGIGDTSCPCVIPMRNRLITCLWRVSLHRQFGVELVLGVKFPISSLFLFVISLRSIKISDCRTGKRTRSKVSL
ncbi:uncharacterized protein LOC110913952 [Helianthus annuus]|uniref:uncharacterized protein LOC110913952 n=1 Tax=Helianthus annuus TaxID=4232 RepID=UPI000B8F996E|nr:uncharacterized protein LOC110913952 [Helianthus annuus]